MRFFSPWGFLALIGVPLILLMYLLKRKYQEKEIASLLLWQKAILLSQAQRPWQKLRRNLLMALQIAAVVLLAFSLAKPYVSGSTQAQDYVLAIDCSLSMQAEESDSGSRWETAKQKAETWIDDAPYGSTFSVVALSDTPYVALRASAEKEEVKDALARLEVTGGGVRWAEAEELLVAEKNTLGGEVVIFSDDYYDFAKLDALWEIQNAGADNTALTLLSYTEQTDGMYVMVRAEHYGAEAQKEIGLFIDGALFDTAAVSLPENGTVDVVFTGVPKQGTSWKASLMQSDALEADNTVYAGFGESGEQKVLLVTEQNIFLEKAVSLMDGVSLFRASPEEADSLNGYSWYIYDGCVPEQMPEDGYVLLINPPAENGIVSMGQMLDITGSARGGNTELLEGIEDISFDLMQAREVTEAFGTAFLRADGKTIAAYGEKNGRKLAVIGFDLHESDLPLKAEFPILLYRLYQWYFPGMQAGSADSTVGEAISFSLQPQTVSAAVVLPDGSEVAIAPPFPAAALTDTAQVGVYRLQETDSAGGKMESTFAVNVKTQGESDLRLQQEAPDYAGGETKTVQAGKNLRSIGLLLLLILLAVEWRVSCRAN